MPHLTLTLLGSFQARIDDQLITHFRAVKNQALLAYLAMTADRAHPRATLAALLWPEAAEAQARLNLRQALFQLRSLLQPTGTAPDTELLRITPQTVQFQRAAHWIDAHAFTQQIEACIAHTHVELATCPACLVQLAQTVDLYRQDFLHDLTIDDSPPLEEWITWQRQRLQEQLFFALQTLIQAHTAQGDFQAVYRYAQRQVEVDPLREEGHRQLLRALALCGQVDAALAHYERCRRLFKKELGVPLEEKTKDLYQQIKRGHFPSPRSLNLSKGTGDSPTSAPVRPDSPPATRHSPLPSLTPPQTGPIYGRQTEIAQLTRWLVQERCQLVALLGIGGMGKTTLAASVAQGVAADFDQVFWCSLLNAPPLEEVLRPVLQRLAVTAQPGNLPTTPGEQLALLLAHFQQRRSLLILDNLESLLDEATPGQIRAGYASYAQLLTLLVENRHVSCVLLTSRERPAKLEQWAEDLPWVRSLRLAGLDHTAGGALLDARGLAGQAEAITLVNRYSGNPLALKLVAHTIHELFGGAIGDFLRTETPIFDDIRAVLDQQFARLTALEAELLVWLAIVREPISRDDLRQNLVQTPPTAPFLAALRALQRRSLLEVTAGGFTLQNVVTEYVTARLVAQVVAELVEADTMTERVPSGREVAWSPPHLVTQPWLNRYPLLQAQAKEYVRQSQARLIVQPVAEQLAALGTQRLPQRFHTYLADLRATQPHAPGYAAGNLLNLLRALRLELTGYDFSRLCVWQADLRGVAAAPLNLAAADLAHSAFTLNFTTYAVRFNSAGQVLIAGVASSKVSVWVAEQGQLHAAFHSPSHGAYPIVFSDDGRILAAGSLDYRIQLWSAETGDPLHRLLEHEAKITALLIHTRSQTVVSSSVDGMVCLWDLASGRLRHTLHGHTSEVGALALTPEGTLLASGSVDGTIRLWNPHTGQYLAQLTGQQGSISALSFLADGHWLAGGSDAGTLYWWDVVTAHNAASVNPTIPCLGQAQRHASRIRVLAFHREGNLLASGSSDRTIGLWRISASAELVVGNAEHRVDAVTPLALLPVSNDGATPSHSPTPTGEESVPTPHAGRVRAGLTITPIHTLIGHTYEVASVAFAADGTRLVSGGAERMVRLWETAAGQPLGVLHGHATVLHSVRFSPNGALIASGGADGIVRLWDGRAANPTILRHCEGHTAQIFTLAFHPAGTLLASGSGDQTIRLWDVPTGQRVATLPGHAHYVLSVAFSSDGRWLASGSADGTVRLWSLAQIGLPTGGGAAQPAAMLRLSETGGVFCVVFSPDGRTLFCSCLNQLYSVPVSDLAATLRTLEHDELPPSIIPLLGHTGRINRVDISPDGARVASISMDHTLRLWDARTGQALAVRSGQGMGNSAVAFDPTGCWFAYNVEELAIAIADAHTLEVVQILRGHVSTILSLHFSPAQPQENPRLVSCGWDGTIRLWDIERGVCLQTWLIPGPYAGMNIRNATGISPAQQAALVALGATA